LIKSIGKYSIELHRDPFESLLKSIIYQQLSGKSANAIFKRFLDYYDGKVPKPDQIIETPDELFRTKIGLSYKKIEYIKDLSSRISTKTLDLSLLSALSDEEIIAELIKVKGIGRWTAEMFLIFTLGRQDVMPLGDLGVKKAIQKLYNLSYMPDSQYISKISSSWRPYRSIATWYLWKSLSNFDNIGKQENKKRLKNH
jgi:DNA-3-methyladenine glycosylase II